MKKVVFGSFLVLAGVLAAALLLAGSMGNEWTVNGQFSAFWNLSQYGLMPAFYCFIGIAVLGFIVALIGLFEKKERG
ncbi:MAG: hypothetical protein ACOX6U_03260 [Oscillospiraceae bacterium]|jgi:hypothetical protein